MGGLKVGVGLSRQADTGAAAREAAHQALARAELKRGSWALCFFSAQHLQGAELLRADILRETGCTALCGCSALAVIAGDEELEGEPGIAVMVGKGDGVQARSAILPEDGAGLETFAASDKQGEGVSLLIALPDSFQVDVNRIRDRVVAELPDTPVFGAGATDDGTVGLSLQMGMEGVRNRSLALLGLAGRLEMAVGITQSCAAVGEPHFITASRENILIELDGKPALAMLMEMGQELGLQDFQQLAREVMFGFPLDVENPEFVGETCLVRPLSGLDQESHGLVIPLPLKNQSSMAFMHRNPRSAEQDMTRMVESVGQGLSGPPDFGVYFDCAARGKGLYGRGGVDARIIRGRFGSLPLIGMFGGYELATALGLANVYTYTGVLLLVRGTS
jgi:small ligand-binding sensory domain FIST